MTIKLVFIWLQEHFECIISFINQKSFEKDIDIKRRMVYYILMANENKKNILTFSVFCWVKNLTKGR